MKKKKSKKGCLPAVIIGVVLACFIGACNDESELSETITAVTTVIESVLKSEYTTEFISATTEAMSSTTLPETTKKQSTSTQKQTTTQKETTNNITTTEKKTTTTTKNVTTTKKPTTTTKVTTTKKVITTNKPTITAKPSTTKKVTTTKKPTTTKKAVLPQAKTTKKQNGKTNGKTVYITPSGERWHLDPDCPGKNGRAVSIEEVGSRTPCKKCAQ